MRLLFAVLLCVGFQVQGQDEIRTYYTDDDKKTEDIALSTYYVVEVENPNKIDTMRSFYTATKTIRSKEVVSEGKINNGAYIQFHPNGQMAIEGNFEKNLPLGIFNNWYSNGNRQSVEKYLSGSFKMVDYWTESGKQIVKSGTGYCECVFKIYQRGKMVERGKLIDSQKDSVWTGVRDSVTYYEEIYNQGKLISGISYDDDRNSYTYTEIEKMAEPMGGLTLFYKSIGSSLTYPKKAKKDRVQGMVFVEFLVNKDGSLSDFKIIKGIGSGCDDEAINTLREIDIKWNPGYQRGKPVRTRFVLPVGFKL
ncbi:MAG TPA: TonB family protein [Chryseolinea sp.]|nr:TonB family protein [Chryseolinea sp.]HPM30823.1 TonB family protein [Chryseolinea sp.]